MNLNLSFCILLTLCLSFTDLGQSPYPRHYTTVDEKKMSYTTFGLTTRRPGDPTVVFEAGFGRSGSLSFTMLFPGLSPFTSGIGYDRNGEGGSEEDSSIVTDADLVHRLHDFLKAVKVPPPYIMVGHSIGGPYIRLFTALYPDEVAGLVFIDPPDFMLTDQQEQEIQQISHSNKGIDERAVTIMDSAANDTLLGPLARHRSKRLATLFRKGVFQEYHSLPPLLDIPVTILFAYNKQQDTSRYSPDDLAKYREIDNFRMINFSAMIANNHHSSLIILPGYSHTIQVRDPDLVVSAVKQIYITAINVRDSRTNKKTAPKRSCCPSLQ